MKGRDPSVQHQLVDLATGIASICEVGIQRVGTGKMVGLLEMLRDAAIRARSPSGPVSRDRESDTGQARVVLLVESDPLVLLPLEYTLRDRGYIVLGARSSTEARALLELVEHRVDAVVVDLELQDTDARDLVRALQRASPGLPALYVARSGQEGPGEQVLPRPLRAADLLAAVAELD